jgi:ABC-2 type transport system permease protein
VHVGMSLGMIAGFLVLCLLIVTWMFRTGYRLKN